MGLLDDVLYFQFDGTQKKQDLQTRLDEKQT